MFDTERLISKNHEFIYVQIAGNSRGSYIIAHHKIDANILKYVKIFDK